MTPIRTHRALQTIDLDGQRVRLAGWVLRRRDHGGVTFIDLRDASGVVQVVADPEQLPLEVLFIGAIEFVLATFVEYEFALGLYVPALTPTDVHSFSL